jgi:hypothetical protein
MTGAPAKMIRADDAVAQIRAGRLREQLALRAAQEAMATVAGLKGLSEVKMNPDDPNVLTEVVRRVEE